MYKDEYMILAEGAKNKVHFLKNNLLGYIVASMLAGIYVGFGMILIYTLGDSLGGSPLTKTIMGAAFPVALSLVVMAGSELFTGNNLAMTAGVLTKRVKISEALYLWIVCYTGNLLGSALLGAIYSAAGYTVGDTGVYFAAGALAKMSHSNMELFFRGVLCNICVCVAVWCSIKLKSESGKLIMIFWAIFAFISSGFEHSIANMTLFTIALLRPNGVPVTINLALNNLLFVTLGNIVGGVVFIGLGYYIISRDRRKA